MIILDDKEKPQVFYSFLTFLANDYEGVFEIG